MIKNKKIIFFIFTIFCFLVDQVSKFFINSAVAINEKIVLLPNVLSLEKVYNTGAAFSILENNTFFLILISCFAVFLISFFIFRSKEKLGYCEIFALGLICGGALGNLFDRLIYFYVIDFLQFEFIKFPIFNFADVFINVGVIILLVNIFVLKNEQQ